MALWGGVGGAPATKSIYETAVAVASEPYLGREARAARDRRVLGATAFTVVDSPLQITARQGESPFFSTAQSPKGGEARHGRREPPPPQRHVASPISGEGVAARESTGADRRPVSSASRAVSPPAAVAARALHPPQLNYYSKAAAAEADAADAFYRSSSHGGGSADSASPRTPAVKLSRGQLYSLGTKRDVRFPAASADGIIGSVDGEEETGFPVPRPPTPAAASIAEADGGRRHPPSAAWVSRRPNETMGMTDAGGASGRGATLSSSRTNSFGIDPIPAALRDATSFPTPPVPPRPRAPQLGLTASRAGPNGDEEGGLLASSGFGITDPSSSSSVSSSRIGLATSAIAEPQTVSRIWRHSTAMPYRTWRDSGEGGESFFNDDEDPVVEELLAAADRRHGEIPASNRVGRLPMSWKRLCLQEGVLPCSGFLTSKVDSAVTSDSPRLNQPTDVANATTGGKASSSRRDPGDDPAVSPLVANMLRFRPTAELIKTPSAAVAHEDVRRDEIARWHREPIGNYTVACPTLDDQPGVALPLPARGRVLSSYDPMLVDVRNSGGGKMGTASTTIVDFDPMVTRHDGPPVTPTQQPTHAAGANRPLADQGRREATAAVPSSKWFPSRQYSHLVQVLGTSCRERR